MLVDVSASGHFGSSVQSKRDVAAELACVLALSATRNNDKVGLVLFTDQIELYIPPKKGRRHVLRVVREILFFRPSRRGHRYCAGAGVRQSDVGATLGGVSDFGFPVPRNQLRGADRRCAGP